MERALHVSPIKKEKRRVGYGTDETELYIDPIDEAKDEEGVFPTRIVR